MEWKVFVPSWDHPGGLPAAIALPASWDFYFHDNEINPELILKFPIQANVKFHELPIDEVIKLQEAKP